MATEMVAVMVHTFLTGECGYIPHTRTVIVPNTTTIEELQKKFLTPFANETASVSITQPRDLGAEPPF